MLGQTPSPEELAKIVEEVDVDGMKILFIASKPWGFEDRMSRRQNKLFRCVVYAVTIINNFNHLILVPLGIKSHEPSQMSNHQRLL